MKRKDVEALLSACEPGNEAFGPELDRMTRRKMREPSRVLLLACAAIEAGIQPIE